MDRVSEFIVATIVLDVVLLGLLQVIQLPADPRIYNLVAILVVSPLLAYLIVRWDTGRLRGDGSKSS